MKLVNRKIHEKININDLIHRIKEVYKFSDDKQLSDLFGISPQDLSNRKKRGTLINLILDAALNENVNLNWLFTGKGDELISNSVSSKIFKKEDLSLIRTLNLCGDEYKKRIYTAATVRAQNVIEKKKLETKAKLQAQEDFEILSTAAVE